LAEIDGILTFKAARDTIREACFTPRRLARHLGPSDRLGRMEPGLWVSFHGAWEAARTAADDVWLKDADYAPRCHARRRGHGLVNGR
jgi:hypothetical protein